MTEKPMERRKPAGQLNWLWMIVSIAAVGGFLAWLGAKSEPSSQVTVVEEADASDGMAATVVTLADLAAGTDAYVGQVIRVENVAVASRLGNQAFWTTLPNNTPFLVKLGTELVGSGFTVQGGEVVAVTGRLVAMSDSVLSAWQQQGALADDGQRMEAEFATMFVEASQAQRPGGGAEDAGGAE